MGIDVATEALKVAVRVVDDVSYPVLEYETQMEAMLVPRSLILVDGSREGLRKAAHEIAIYAQSDARLNGHPVYDEFGRRLRGSLERTHAGYGSTKVAPGEGPGLHLNFFTDIELNDGEETRRLCAEPEHLFLGYRELRTLDEARVLAALSLPTSAVGRAQIDYLRRVDESPIVQPIVSIPGQVIGELEQMFAPRA